MYGLTAQERDIAKVIAKILYPIALELAKTSEYEFGVKILDGDAITNHGIFAACVFAFYANSPDPILLNIACVLVTNKSIGLAVIAYLNDWNIKKGI